MMFLKRLKSKLFGDSVIPHMRNALNEEYDFIKEKGSGTRRDLYAGVLKGKIGSFFIYEFPLEDEFYLPDDTPIELATQDRSIRGFLISTIDGTLSISLQDNIGESVSKATLISKPDFLIKSLFNAISKAGRNDLAEKLFNRKKPSLKRDFDFSIKGIQPNQWQKEAIANSIGSNVSFIWGPPGTGKTQTLAMCVEALLSRGLKLLITSNTNVAVDNALVQISQRIGKQDKKIARIGTPHIELPDEVLVFNSVNEIMEKKKFDARVSLEDIHVIGTTLAKCYASDAFSNLRFNAVIIDEASMANLPSLYFGSTLATDRIIVAGDFRQLLPIAQNDDSFLVKRWLKTDIFTEAGVVDSVESGRNDPRLVMLKTQYRMYPPICELISDFAYSGLLQSHPSVRALETIVKKQPIPDSALTLIDTSDSYPWCNRQSGSTSKINLYHAIIAIELAKIAIKNGFAVAIVTPYKDQCRLIRRAVSDEKLQEKIPVATVHRFQGRETDVVIFDVTDSPPFEPRWLKSEESKNLFTVGLSRAKAKLIVIANMDYLKLKLGSKDPARYLCCRIAERGLLIKSKEILPKSLEPIQTKDRLITLDDLSRIKVAFFDQTSFYDAFTLDLHQATKKVTILSPFITTYRFSRLEGIFKDLRQKNVEIAVITKPIDEMFDTQNLRQDALTVVDHLRKLKVDVVQRPKTHEKIAIIDDGILWEGSLNILSHRDTEEVMFRLNGFDRTVEQLLYDLKLEKPKFRRRTTKIQKIAAIREGMKNVTIEGKALEVIVRRVWDGRERKEKEVADVTVSDGTGSIVVAIWGNDIRKIKQGRKIRIENGYAKSYRDRLQISTRYGKVIAK